MGQIIMNRSLTASKAIMGASLALVLCGSGTSARADAIPYPTAGVVNSEVYTFTAGATGDIIAYFAGSTAFFDNQLGLLVDGVDTGKVGLDNHTSPLDSHLTSDTPTPAKPRYAQFGSHAG